MIVKKEYKNRALKYTLIDDVEKVDVSEDNGITFLNVYKNNRKKDDDFETINIEGINVYVCNDNGKTLAIYRG